MNSKINNRILLFLFLLIGLKAHAQKISGVVLDKKLHLPLVGASVYISNSTIGCITDKKGIFELSNNSFEQFEIVISFIGYKTQVIEVRQVSDSNLIILLDSNSVVLADVTIRPYEKNGWDRWGFLFKNLFIGTSAFSDKCTILNPKDIQFYFSEVDNILMINNKNPIAIINKALGYKVEYDLQNFYFDLESQLLQITGYPHFIELQGSKRQMSTWKKNRDIAYKGSLMHFIRALSSGTAENQGFIVRILKVIQRPEKLRVNSILRMNKSLNNFPEDSIRYYRKILRRNDDIILLDKNPIDTKNLIYKNSEKPIEFLFKDYLYITYPKAKEVQEYLERNQNVAYDNCITGIIHLDKYEPIEIFPSGNYIDPTNLLVSGYWSWWEKTATLLPLDYIPEEN